MIKQMSEARRLEVVAEANKQALNSGPCYVGKLWHSKRKFSWVIRFDGKATTFEDGSRFEPIERCIANTVGYRVFYTVVVDHPEKRDRSYHPVPAGTVINSDAFFEKPAHAVAYYDAIVAGREDFGSEFMSSASVKRLLVGGKTEEYHPEIKRSRP